jgi:hypothetical protein
LKKKAKKVRRQCGVSAALALHSCCIRAALRIMGGVAVKVERSETVGHPQYGYSCQ